MAVETCNEVSTAPRGRTRGHRWRPPEVVLHLKPGAGLAISGGGVRIVTGVRVAGAAAAVHVAGGGGASLLELEALLELRDDVGHGGALRRGSQAGKEKKLRKGMRLDIEQSCMVGILWINVSEVAN